MVDSNLESVVGPSQPRIRLIKEEDIEAVTSILKQWVRHWETRDIIQDEIDEIVLSIEKSINGENNYRYFLAESQSGEVQGIVGYRLPDKRMLDFTTSDKAIELTNFYIGNDFRGKGIGKALFQKLERAASEEGFDQVVLNSGPRYKDTAWPFYDSYPGLGRVGTAKDMYGQGIDAPVWRKDLSDKIDVK